MYTYSFYILHIEYHIAHMYAKFWWSHLHHTKGSAGLTYPMKDCYFKYELTWTLYYFLYFIFSWVVVIFRTWINYKKFIFLVLIYTIKFNDINADFCLHWLSHIFKCFSIWQVSKFCYNFFFCAITVTGNWMWVWKWVWMQMCVIIIVGTRNLILMTSSNKILTQK